VARYKNKKFLSNLWLEEYASKGHCMICGNKGIIDTRGNMKTPAGYPCGGIAFCICPNGRVMKVKGCKLE
jgi:hypothetical protein